MKGPASPGASRAGSPRGCKREGFANIAEAVGSE